MTTPAPTQPVPTIPASGGDWAINLERVAKTYKGRWWGGGRKGVPALRGITMRVHRGEIFGLLGPNGAGKSTLVKILMTIIRASECHGAMLERPVGTKSVLERVGYLPEHHKFPDYLTGAQVLDFYGALAKVPRETRKRRSAELLEMVGMSRWGRTKVKGYSKGMRQRLGIANALMSDPELVLLDEPTDGVDPVGRRDIRAILQRLRDEGKTVFLNSHMLSELEMVCDRVAILVQGVVSAQGTMDELTRNSRRYEIEVAPPSGEEHGPAAAGFLPRALSAVALLPEPTLATDAPSAPAGASGPVVGRLRGGGADIPIIIDHHSISVGTDEPAAVQPLIDVLRHRGFTIRAVRPVRASLEDLFMLAVTDPNTGEILKPGAADTAARPALTPPPRQGDRA